MTARRKQRPLVFLLYQKGRDSRIFQSLREGRTVMRAIFFRLVLVGAMSAVAPLAHSQLLSHRDLSYSEVDPLPWSPSGF